MSNNIINVTPHAINIFNVSDCTPASAGSYAPNEGAQPVFTIEPSGVVARVSTGETETSTIDGIQLVSVVFGDIENLPAEAEGTRYIVSAIVASAAREKGRKDLLTVARSVRDANGRIVGCCALAE